MSAPVAEDRRTRNAQRDVVEDVLPDDGIVLRTVEGEVVVYEALPVGNKLATDVRARVLPDGDLLVPERRRFRR